MTGTRRLWRLSSCGLALLLSAAIGACGGERAVTTSKPAQSSEEAGARFTSTTTSVIPAGQSLRGDGDADNPGDIDGNGDSDSAAVGGPDADSDSPTRVSYAFPDADDQSTFAYGHRPRASEAHAIAAVLARYYAAASSGDGQAACKLLLPSLARSVPEDYGQASTSPGVRTARTCGAVLATVFHGVRGQLAEAITVVEVRVSGARAQVVFSSRAMPASNIYLARQGKSWRVATVLGQPLP